MGIHVDDLAIVLCSALEDTPTAHCYEWVYEGERRDEPITVYATGRDWFRHFKIRIEVVDDLPNAVDAQSSWRTHEEV